MAPRLTMAAGSLPVNHFARECPVRPNRSICSPYPCKAGCASIAYELAYPGSKRGQVPLCEVPDRSGNRT